MRGLQRLINFYKKVKTWAGNTQLLKRWKYGSQKGRLIFLPPLAFSLQKVGSPGNRRSSTQVQFSKGPSSPLLHPRCRSGYGLSLVLSLIPLPKVYAHSPVRRDPDILLLPSYIPVRLGTKALITALDNLRNREFFLGLYLSLSLVTSFLGLVTMLNLPFIKPVRPNIFLGRKRKYIEVHSSLWSFWYKETWSLKLAKS